MTGGHLSIDVDRGRSDNTWAPGKNIFVCFVVTRVARHTFPSRPDKHGGAEIHQHPSARGASKWRLDGRVALVTGSSKGIGFETAREFVELGATVIVNGRRADELEEAVSLLRPLAVKTEVTAIVADISTEAGRAEVIAHVERAHGRLDCLVNNAGTNVRAPALEASDADYARIMALNLDAVYHLTRGLHPIMSKSVRPTIVNVTSAAGVQSTGSGAAYAMSKAAVVQLTKTLACEWAPKFRVNAIAPWVTWTPPFAMPSTVTRTSARASRARNAPRHSGRCAAGRDGRRHRVHGAPRELLHHRPDAQRGRRLAHRGIRGTHRPETVRVVE